MGGVETSNPLLNGTSGLFYFIADFRLIDIMSVSYNVYEKVFERLKKKYDCNNLLYDRLPAPVLTVPEYATRRYKHRIRFCMFMLHLNKICSPKLLEIKYLHYLVCALT